MLKTRIILIIISGLLIGGLFLLPKVVVDNDDASLSTPADGEQNPQPASDVHTRVAPDVASSITRLRAQYETGSENEKNAIFADSLANLYEKAGKFDSAAWFSEASSKFFNTIESWNKTGDYYYQAYTFAVDQGKQSRLAGKAQEYYQKVLDKDPKQLEVKTKLAMTYFGTSDPAKTMNGVSLLREVLKEDPKNELALFNMGMLSVQSGQHSKAIGRLEELIKINPNHTQGRLLLGIALMNTGDKKGAKEQFEKVKQLDNDPAVQATVDTYLKDLK
jgi:outer membrane protein